MDSADRPNARHAGVVRIDTPSATATLQQLPYFIGVSEQTAGAAGLSMNLVVIPPGAKSLPHSHNGFETAIYVLQGRVKTLWGPGLHEQTISAPGEFLYIAPGVPHQAVNLSGSEPAMAIVARNSARERESVSPYYETGASSQPDADG